MEALGTSTQKESYHFLKDYGNNRVKRKVLAFLGTHPNTKFTRYVICRALECSKLEMGEALSDLANASQYDKEGK